MRYPTLDELPPPPPDKSGWPWNEASEIHRDALPKCGPWPLVTIVTPSYNQGAFLEQTIRSVLLQGYPNLEYIVIDGGSKDESISILRKYEPWLSNWVSEPDGGQSDAINKGFARANGEILGWLNSDDLYAPNALLRVAVYFSKTPYCDLVYGNGWYIDEEGHKKRRCHWVKPYQRRLLLTFNFILQPAAFWRRSLWERAGELDVSQHWAMDWDWLLRATAITTPHYLRKDLALWRVRAGMKTVYGGWARRIEIATISRKYGGIWQPTHLAFQLDRMVWLLSRPFGAGVTRRIAQALLGLVPWMLKRTVWRGRQLSEFSVDKI